jgi:exosortase/archaeosortase family protein
MKRFAALYFLFLGLLFTLFYLPTSTVSLWINEVQTGLTLDALALFLREGQLQGIDIWITPDYKIIITQACNGMIPLLILYAAILAYRASWRKKLLWMVLGYLLFFVVNIIRILLVVYVTQNGEGQGDFYWSHDIVGNTLLMLTGLGVFILYIKDAHAKN